MITSPYKQLPEDTSQPFRGQSPIPNPLGIDDQPRAFLTDTQAGGLGTHDGDAEFFGLRLELIPKAEVGGGITAIRTDAKKEMLLGLFITVLRTVRVVQIVMIE